MDFLDDIPESMESIRKMGDEASSVSCVACFLLPRPYLAANDSIDSYLLKTRKGVTGRLLEGELVWLIRPLL